MNVMGARVVLRERSMLDVADLALRFVATHARVYAQLFAFVALPGLALSVAASFGGWALAWAVTVVMTAFADAPFVAAAARLVFADKATAGEAIGMTTRALPGLLLLRLVQSIGLLLAGAVMVVPALWVGAATLFLAEVHVLERAGRAGATLVRASRIARARHGTALAATLLLAAAPLAASAIGDVAGREFLDGVLDVRPPPSMFRVGGSWLALCGWWAAVPLLATARFFLYLDFRTRTEGWDIQTRFAAIAARTKQEATDRSPASLRRGAAALVAVAVLAGISLPRVASAAVDPSHAAADVATTMSDRGYAFCQHPSEPLAPEALALCPHATQIASCEGFAAACTRAKEAERPENAFPRGMSDFARIVDELVHSLVWLAVAGVVVLVLLPIARAIALRRKREPKAAAPAPDSPAAPVADGVADLEDGAEALLARADDLARRGHADTALELYLGASLHALHERGAIRLGKDRTNGEYVRSCADGGTRSALAGLVGDVELVKFGGRPATGELLAHASRSATWIVRALVATAALCVLASASACGFRMPQPGDDPAGDEVWTALMRRQGFELKPLGSSLASLPLPEEPDDAPAVIVRSGTVVDGATKDHLRDWVAAGGVLVLAGLGPDWPKELSPRAASPHRGRVLVPFGGRTEQADVEDGAALDELAENATTLAKFADGPVYATALSHGAGDVITLASDELLTNVALLRAKNAGAAVALFAGLEGRTLEVAGDLDGVTPPTTPLDALEHAGLSAGVWHALAAAALLFLAAGVRLTRAKPSPPPASQPFAEHVRAVGALYGRAAAAPHALAAYARFAQERLRARMPRRAPDVPTFLAAHARLPVDVSRRLWARAEAAAATPPPQPAGDELAVLEELVAAYSVTTQESA